MAVHRAKKRQSGVNLHKHSGGMFKRVELKLNESGTPDQPLH
jgi:hypothetical protein